MSVLTRYAAVLRAPHVLPLVLASMLARLPIGIEGLAVVLYLSQARGSFAVAGLVSGGFALGAAVGAPLQSRLIDRLGQRTVLLPAALGNALRGRNRKHRSRQRKSGCPTPLRGRSPKAHSPSRGRIPIIRASTF